jgi:hypothetical protein
MEHTEKSIQQESKPLNRPKPLKPVKPLPRKRNNFANIVLNKDELWIPRVINQLTQELRNLEAEELRKQLK